MSNHRCTRRGICFALSVTLLSVCSLTDASARQRFSTIQGNIHEEAEIEPFAGGQKSGLIQDWELLCKIEKEDELREKVMKSAGEGSLEHTFILGCMYLQGKGVERNQQTAFEMFKTAANKGHSKFAEQSRISL